MVHEVKDIPRFFGQVAEVLRPGGTMLIAEPRVHVMQRRFDEILDMPGPRGSRSVTGPKVAFSRAAVLVRGA